MINKVLNEKSFYFSYMLDLTKSVQKNLTETLAANAAQTNINDNADDD